MVTGRPKIIRRLRRISRLARNGIRIPRATLLDTINPPNAAQELIRSFAYSDDPGAVRKFNQRRTWTLLFDSDGVIQVQVDRISRIIDMRLHSHQLRPMLEACKRAKINPAISFHVLRHTHGSTLAMRGVPMGVIAEQLGHADTRMTEKHYAHLAPSYVADTIRANFPTLGIAGDPTVVPIKR
jgi:integrase